MKSLRAIFAGAVLVAAFQQPSQAADPSIEGQWTQPFSLPLIAMHASLLPTGKVLLYSAEHGVPGVQAYVLDPVTLALTDVPPPGTWIPACSGHSFLADGRLLVTGGQIGTEDPPLGTTECNIFNSFTEQWIRIEDTRRGRWYASNITLGDGRIVTFSGLDEYSDFNPDIELWDPKGTNNWQLLGERIIDYYPNLHLLTNGLVFRSGPNDSGQTDTYNVSNNVWTYIATRNVGGRFNAPSVMLPPNPNRIMVMGGNMSTNQPTSSAEIIDLNSPNPQWTAITPMHYVRMDFNSVILPNGKIFVIGGRTNFLPTAIYAMTPEIFDPQNLTWTTVAPHQIPRWYHSTAILLPDGRVMAAGSNDQPTGEIYSPPYLFQGTRPVIQSVPRVIQYGQNFSLTFTSTTATNRVALIRNTCVTHSVNMEQRYVRLADLTNGSGTFTVPGPATGNLAPPGYYMLYVINQNGVPSVSTMVHVLPEPLKILEARKTGSGSIQFFWSLSFANATVQTTASLRPPTTWVSQPGTPTIQGGRYTLTVPATSNPTFFRLSSQ
jgi:galactose oxidase